MSGKAKAVSTGRYGRSQIQHIAAIMAGMTGKSFDECRLMVNATYAAIYQLLLDGAEVRIPHIGRLVWYKRKGRTTRFNAPMINPTTKKELPKFIIHKERYVLKIMTTTSFLRDSRDLVPYVYRQTRVSHNYPNSKKDVVYPPGKFRERQKTIPEEDDMKSNL